MSYTYTTKAISLLCSSCSPFTTVSCFGGGFLVDSQFDQALPSYSVLYVTLVQAKPEEVSSDCVLPPLPPLFPSTLTSYTFLMSSPCSNLQTWPNHLGLLSLIPFLMGVILASAVRLHFCISCILTSAFLNIRISRKLNLSASVQVSLPYNRTGLIDDS